MSLKVLTVFTTNIVTIISRVNKSNADTVHVLLSSISERNRKNSYSCSCKPLDFNFNLPGSIQRLNLYESPWYGINDPK